MVEILQRRGYQSPIDRQWHNVPDKELEANNADATKRRAGTVLENHSVGKLIIQCQQSADLLCAAAFPIP